MSITNLKLSNIEFKDKKFENNEDDEFEDDEFEDYEFIDDEIEEGTTEKITDHFCTQCNSYFCSKQNLKNHFVTLRHKVKLERLEILEISKNSEDAVCSIPLRNRKGMIIDYTIVDKDVYPLIMNYPIYKNAEGYANISIDNKISYLHRYIYYDLQNRQPMLETVVDHMDRQKLNNALCNLQESSHGNNIRNRDKKENCSSDYHGVSKNNGLWNCTLRYNNVQHSFLYKDELHAAYHHNLLIKEFNLQNHNPLNNVECPADFIIKTKYIKKSGLPKHITAHRTKYRCTFNGELKNKSKTGFKTVEEAVLYRDQVLEIHEKQKLDNLNKPYDGPIKRNFDGIALFNVTNKNREIVAETLVDDEIYCYLMKHNHRLNISKKGYVSLCINGKKERIHRWIFGYFGPLKIDHIDRNPLNNQKSNLRISTDLQNAQNRSSRKGASSKYVGVSFHKDNKKWQARIQGEYLGSFETEKEAVIERNERAQELNSKGSTYPIEIYDGPTEQTEICDGLTEQIETYDGLTEQIEIYDNPIKFADRLIKQIELYNLSTEQIKNNKNDEFHLKNSNIDNKISIKYEETPEDILYKEYIMNINKVTVLYKEVMIKKLNIKNGGPIKLTDIKSNNLDKYKKIIIDTLYPS